MIVATNNEGKLKEIKSILEDFDLYSLREKNIDIDVDEDQDTFLGNAKKKAKTIYELSREDVIADDSGLCIKCLNDFPGVMTHRFLGDSASDRDRNKYLINKVNEYCDRTACVICNIVYYNGNSYVVGEGVIEGKIATECRGDNGFGFDEIFELPNGLTLAQLPPFEKNKISARALALNDLKIKLKEKKYAIK